ncbi:MAG: RNA methyltransferase [Bacteroidota bacterium]|nr:RNA methyltransferase [Bacteroidota bacterium]
MLSKSRIKHISSLKIKKYRELYGEFIAEGTKLVTELISSNYESISLYALKEWLSEHKLPNDFRSEIIEVTEAEMSRITSLSSPSPCLLHLKTQNLPFDVSLAERELILMLDDIKDPGNLGTIIRTADWFGFKHIVCSLNTVDLYNPKTIQSTMGSVARVNVSYQELTAILEKAGTKVPVYGSLLDGENILNKELSNNGIIVIGNESIGISEKIRNHINEKIYIPAYQSAESLDKPESLNASIANAIICYEFRRSEMKIM